MSRVVHFEIHADDPERAIAFYGGLFGWSFNRFGEMPYWTISTGPEGEPGIDGGLTRRETPLTGEGFRSFVCVVGVESIDDMVARAEAAGATVAHAKQEIPGVGWSAYIEDAEGNIVGLFQPAPEAG